MENENIEQPELESQNLEASNETDNQEGSMLGKFKDAKTLLEAYNNLQSEFTRKSQKLAEFQKKIPENAIFEQYDNIDDFIAKHTDSDKYKKEITEIIANDKEICSLPNKYQVALKIIKLAESKSAENLSSQDFFDKYIKQNNEFRDKIINEYLSSINNVSNLPKTTFGSSPVYFSPNVDKPKTLQEASEIFKKMLK